MVEESIGYEYLEEDQGGQGPHRTVEAEEEEEGQPETLQIKTDSLKVCANG
jgi:hypothetical protein